MFCLKNISIENYLNAYYVVSNGSGYCFDSNKEFIHNSNDLYYLINAHRPHLPFSYREEHAIKIEGPVIPFVTHFPLGLHAYAGIYSILLNFIKNFERLRDHKLLVYKNIQTGIIEVIEAVLERYGYDKKNIIYIDNNVLYQTDNITLIPNSLHSFWESKEITSEIINLINNSIVFEKDITPNQISIIKHHSSSVASSMGCMDLSTARDLTSRLNYTLIEPVDIGEIEVIKLLRNCEKALFSWGTTFMKNFIYLSEKCRQVDVIIIGSSFLAEYEAAKSRDILPTKFKNAEIFYHTNPDLNSNFIYYPNT